PCSGRVLTALPPLSLHDALPICGGITPPGGGGGGVTPPGGGGVTPPGGGGGTTPPGTGGTTPPGTGGGTPPDTSIATPPAGGTPDRKSTRLNSSHLGISYAVFCL